MKWAYAIVFVVLVLLVGLYRSEIGDMLVGMVVVEPSGSNTMVEEFGIEPEVYFCPEENCTQALVDVLASGDTIDCAFFDIDLDVVMDAMRGKFSRVVIDGQNEHYDDVFILYEDKSSYMHNKFCVIDGKTVVTGSFNPTQSELDNLNNLVIVESPYLAEVYTTEFDELWQGVYGKGDTGKGEMKLNGKEIEVRFCPEDGCKALLLEEISNAEESIYFMTFSFTLRDVATDMLRKNDEGVEVRGVFEKLGSGTKYSNYGYFISNDIDVRKWSDSGKLHHKVFILDNETVITGSFNPSKNGDEKNDENMIVVHDKRIAQEFLDEFDIVWSKS